MRRRLGAILLVLSLLAPQLTGAAWAEETAAESVPESIETVSEYEEEEVLSPAESAEEDVPQQTDADPDVKEDDESGTQQTDDAVSSLGDAVSDGIIEEADSTEIAPEDAEAVGEDETSAGEEAEKTAEEESAQGEENENPAAADPKIVISEVTVSVTSPTVGSKSTDAEPGAAVAATTYSLEYKGWLPGLNEYSSSTPEFTFAAGTTYYMYVTLKAESGYAFAKGYPIESGIDEGKSKFAGTVQVNGGAAKFWGVYGEEDDHLMLKIAVTAVQQKDVWIDNTVDTSKSHVLGKVVVTDKSTGKTTTQEVYNKTASVTFSNPKTAEVQTMIQTATADGRSWAAKQGYTIVGEPVTEEVTGKVWDNRKYETIEDGDAVLIGDWSELIGDYTGQPMTRTHVASGDYGKETTYTVTLQAEYTPHTHKLVKTAAVASTCTKKGTAEYWTCSGCGKKFSDAAGKTEIKAPAALPLKAHTWASSYTVDKAATTSAAGSKSIHCTVCGAVKPGSSVAIPKLEVPKVKLIAAYNGAWGVGVKWIKLAGATEYTIWQKYNGSWRAIKTVKPNDSSLQVSGNTLMYTDQTVKNGYGKGYIYSVSAKVGSTAVDYDRAGVAIYRLNPPELKKASNTKAGTAVVTWKGVFGRTETNGAYDLQYATEADAKAGKWKRVPQKLGNTVTTTTVTGLKKGAKYIFRIRCSKTNKDRGTFYSEYSKWLSVTIKK